MFENAVSKGCSAPALPVHGAYSAAAAGSARLADAAPHAVWMSNRSVAERCAAPILINPHTRAQRVALTGASATGTQGRLKQGH